MKIHIHHASTEWKDNDRLTLKDMVTALRRGAHVVTFSEVFPGNEQLLRSVVRSEGYWLANAEGNDAICVRRGLRTRVLDSGGALVNPGVPGKPPAGGHSPRYATWVTVRMGREVFTVITAHWVTNWGRPDREAEWLEMTEHVLKDVGHHGRGRRLAFVTGDTNMDDVDGTHTALWYAFDGLTTCWDEIGAWPATHRGGTIDIIASYDKDARVRCVAARAWPKGYSDHNPISAWYEVRR